MTYDIRDVIARALFEMDGIEPPVDRDHPIWHNYLTDADAILAALAAEGLVIVSANEADNRVAAAWLEGMEKAAVIVDKRRAGHAVDAATFPDDVVHLVRLLEREASGCSIAIRADMDGGA